jgi:hypothetical protein
MWVQPHDPYRRPVAASAVGWRATDQGCDDAAAHLPLVFSSEQLAGLIRQWRGERPVKFTALVPDGDRPTTLIARGLDVLESRLRQVLMFDSRDAGLARRGISVWVARTQRRPARAGVTLHLSTAEQDFTGLSARTRRGEVEVTAVPGGYGWAVSVKSSLDDVDVRNALAGRRPIGKLFTRRQRELLAEFCSHERPFEDLAAFTWVNVFRMKFAPVGSEHRYIAEVWNYPDKSPVLKLTTKCDLTVVFEVAAATRALLDVRGVAPLVQRRGEPVVAHEPPAHRFRDAQ